MSKHHHALDTGRPQRVTIATSRAWIGFRLDPYGKCRFQELCVDLLQGTLVQGVRCVSEWNPRSLCWPSQSLRDLVKKLSDGLASKIRIVRQHSKNEIRMSPFGAEGECTGRRNPTMRVCNSCDWRLANWCKRLPHAGHQHESGFICKNNVSGALPSCLIDSIEFVCLPSCDFCFIPFNKFRCWFLWRPIKGVSKDTPRNTARDGLAKVSMNDAFHSMSCPHLVYPTVSDRSLC